MVDDPESRKLFQVLQRFCSAFEERLRELQSQEGGKAAALAYPPTLYSLRVQRRTAQRIARERKSASPREFYVVEVATEYPHFAQTVLLPAFGVAAATSKESSAQGREKEKEYDPNYLANLVKLRDALGRLMGWLGKGQITLYRRDLYLLDHLQALFARRTKKKEGEKSDDAAFFAENLPELLAAYQNAMSAPHAEQRLSRNSPEVITRRQELEEELDRKDLSIGGFRYFLVRLSAVVKRTIEEMSLHLGVRWEEEEVYIDEVAVPRWSVKIFLKLPRKQENQHDGEREDTAPSV